MQEKLTVMQVCCTKVTVLSMGDLPGRAAETPFHVVVGSLEWRNAYGLRPHLHKSGVSERTEGEPARRTRLPCVASTRRGEGLTLDAQGSGRRAVIYQLDADDIIVWTNDAFQDFAVENQAASLVECRGKRLWPFISDWDTRSIYRLLIDRVRRTNRSARFSFRCDSP